MLTNKSTLLCCFVAVSRPVFGFGPGALLGARLRELRLKAGLSQAEVARRMGHAHPGYRSYVSRLEAGTVRRPGLAVLAGFLSACGASLADLKGALPGVAVPRRKRKPTGSREERIRRVQARARTLGRDQAFEDRLFEWLDDVELIPEVAHRVVLAEFGRKVFDALLRARAAKRQALEAATGQGVSREDAEGIRGLVEKLFRVMHEEGQLDRPLEVDAAAVVDGEQKLKRLERATKRLGAKHEWRFRMWFEQRQHAIERVRQESRALHERLGLRDRDKRPYLNVVNAFCIIADETEPGTAERERRFGELVAKSGEPEVVRALGEFAVRRFDELKPGIPKKPKMAERRRE